MEFKLLQEVIIKSDSKQHMFKVGDIVTIQRIVPAKDPAKTIYICRLKTNEKRISALTVDDFEAIV